MSRLHRRQGPRAARVRGWGVSYSSDVRTIKAARKRHQCDWCGEDIPAGSSYRTWTGVLDGRWGVTKAHPECCSAMYAAPSYFADDGWTLGSFNRGTDHERGCGCEPSCAEVYASECAKLKEAIERAEAGGRK